MQADPKHGKVLRKGLRSQLHGEPRHTRNIVSMKGARRLADIERAELESKIQAQWDAEHELLAIEMLYL